VGGGRPPPPPPHLPIFFATLGIRPRTPFAPILMRNDPRDPAALGVSARGILFARRGSNKSPDSRGPRTVVFVETQVRNHSISFFFSPTITHWAKRTPPRCSGPSTMPSVGLLDFFSNFYFFTKFWYHAGRIRKPTHHVYPSRPAGMS